MNTLELIEQFAERHGLTRAAAKKLFDGALSAISDAVTAGEEVALNGFGKFKVKHRPARTGRNPQTGAVLKIAASKSISFTPSKTLKTALNATAPKKAAASKAAAKKAPAKATAAKKAAPAKGKK